MIIAVALLASPARAVDYVQCEAMMNAMSRIGEGIMHDAIKLRNKKAIEAATKRCNKQDPRDIYVKCLTTEAEVFKQKNPSEYDEIISHESDKLKRIKRDFANAGCNY